MKADRNPEISGPPQEQTEQEREQPSRHYTHSGLVGVEGMPEGEQARHHDCRGPETYA
jgi:hypothetical protein